MAHILVVEDDALLRRIITMNLVRRGHSVAEAECVGQRRRPRSEAAAIASRQPSKDHPGKSGSRSLLLGTPTNCCRFPELRSVRA